MLKYAAVLGAAYVDCEFLAASHFFASASLSCPLPLPGQLTQQQNGRAWHLEQHQAVGTLHSYMQEKCIMSMFRQEASSKLGSRPGRRGADECKG